MARSRYRYNSTTGEIELIDRPYVPSNPPTTISSQYVFSELKKIAHTTGVIYESEDWHEIGATGEPAFSNSWANRATGNDPLASFYIDPYGRVHLKGVIDTGASGSTAFTLPLGYRPPDDMYFLAMGVGAAAGNYVYIQKTGVVQPTRTGADISLNNISFRI